MKISMFSSRRSRRGGCYLELAFSALILILLVKLLAPQAIPFRLFEFWYFRGSLGEVLQVSLLGIVWLVGLNIYRVPRKWKNWDIDRDADVGEMLRDGFVSSLAAGTLEEITFRWLVFYGEIVMFQVANFLIFGFLGFGIPEWFYLHVVGPVANFFTLRALEPQLFSSLGWMVGAAIIGSNGKFRQGHAYRGPIGLIDSWFMGMLLFWLMFHHGLLAAMLAHVVIDIAATIAAVATYAWMQWYEKHLAF